MLNNEALRQKDRKLDRPLESDSTEGSIQRAGFAAYAVLLLEEYLRLKTEVEAKLLPLFIFAGIYVKKITSWSHIMKDKYIVITNNKSVLEKYNENISIEYVETTYLGILLRVRDKVHAGYELVTHPLMGSVKPNETPYRSIIIKAGTQVDRQSIEIIESSIISCERFLKDKPLPEWNEKVLEDFRFVDIRLFESALSSTFPYML
ncbi:MAG: GrdX family protein [Bacillota bacterium]